MQAGLPGSMENVLKAGILFLVSIPVLFLIGKQFGLLAFIVAFFILYKIGCMRVVQLLLRWLLVPEGNPYREALRRADVMPAPITVKSSEFKEGQHMSYGYSSMQGWRRSMEDSHTAIIEPNGGGFFAVFDGHSGSSVAEFCGENLHRFITSTAAFEAKNYSRAMFDGFLAIDRHLLGQHPRDRSGCTAVSLLIVGDEMYCANAGDSRCVLCRDGEALPLSVDHKPYLTTEQTRIERAGGYVWNRRVNGILALSRAIGDFMFKNNSQIPWEEQAVTAAPEVRSVRMDRTKDEFLVVACDGIWDVMSNEEVVEFVRQRLRQSVPLVDICNALMHHCLSPHPFGLGCDNMSVIVVVFNNPSAGVAAATTNATASTNSSIASAPAASMLATAAPCSVSSDE